jgi:hypothetical protein
MFVKQFRKAMARSAKKARKRKKALSAAADASAADLETSAHSANDTAVERASSATPTVVELMSMPTDELLDEAKEDATLGFVWLTTALDMFVGLLFSVQLLHRHNWPLWLGSILHYWFCTALELLDIFGKLHTGDDGDDDNKHRVGTARWRAIHDYCECVRNGCPTPPHLFAVHLPPHLACTLCSLRHECDAGHRVLSCLCGQRI